MKLFQQRDVVVMSLAFLVNILLLVILTISKGNFLDVSYAVFLSLCFTKYLYIKRES